MTFKFVSKFKEPAVARWNQPLRGKFTKFMRHHGAFVEQTEGGWAWSIVAYNDPNSKGPKPVANGVEATERGAKTVATRFMQNL